MDKEELEDLAAFGEYMMEVYHEFVELGILDEYTPPMWMREGILYHINELKANPLLFEEKAL